jgi:hypothetical protein
MVLISLMGISGDGAARHLLVSLQTLVSGPLTVTGDGPLITVESAAGRDIGI